MNESRLPKTLQEAIIYFADPDTCTEFLAAVRWPEGPVCPRCGGKEHGYISTRRIWRCKSCRREFTVKLGTIFEDSPISLQKWLPAVWLIVNSKNGISSYEVARSLGVSQKTAWHMLHRIRLAMQSGSFEKLSGHVEVDETFIGGKARNMHISARRDKITGRGGVDKTMVVGALERDGKVRLSVGRIAALRPFRGSYGPTWRKARLSRPMRSDRTSDSMGTTPTKSWTTRSNTSTARFTPTGLRTSGAC